MERNNGAAGLLILPTWDSTLSPFLSERCNQAKMREHFLSLLALLAFLIFWIIVDAQYFLHTKYPDAKLEQLPHSFGIDAVELYYGILCLYPAIFELWSTSHSRYSEPAVLTESLAKMNIATLQPTVDIPH